jgi:hypothetical protein
MYEGLYNVRKGLSEQDAGTIGLMTAKLLLCWDEWQHRRVEEISFDQDDAATRDISLDFTLPHWFHEMRRTPEEEAKRQLVPLTFLRKQSLINFRLRDDCNCALPLLTRWQNAQVAEATLIVLASKLLGGAEVPHEIRCDIRNLVGAMRGTGSISCDELFGRRDPHLEQRGRLAGDETFSRLARAFEANFLACSMIDIARHRRKVVHLSYEELMIRSREVPWPKRLISIARGGTRDLVITVPRASAAESSHVEVVAPDLLQIVDRRQVSKDSLGEVDKDVQRPGGHKRAHFHFGGEGSKGAVTVTLIPSATTYTRLATLASALGFVAIVVALWAAPSLRNGEGSVDAAAAILLSFSAVIGLFAATKDGGTNMVQELLWPVQLLSMTPVLWTFLAGLTILAPLGATATQLCLGALALLALLCTAQLIAVARETTTPVRSDLMTQKG